MITCFLLLLLLLFFFFFLEYVLILTELKGDFTAKLKQKTVEQKSKIDVLQEQLEDKIKDRIDLTSGLILI